MLDRFKALFPADDPTLGAPFHTGDVLFDRVSAYYCDEMFLGARRLWFNNGASRMPMYAYHFREFVPGNDRTLGGEINTTNFIPSLILIE